VFPGRILKRTGELAIKKQPSLRRPMSLTLEAGQGRHAPPCCWSAASTVLQVVPVGLGVTLNEPIGDAVMLPRRNTILLVEDDLFARLATAQDLTDAGFQVIQVTSGVEAWRVLQSGVEIDLVLTDIHMPGGADGIDLARWLRAIRPDLKVAVLSGDLRIARTAASAICSSRSHQLADLVKGIGFLLECIPNNDKP
jgi:two-component system, response regulator PdtaR